MQNESGSEDCCFTEDIMKISVRRHKGMESCRWKEPRERVPDKMNIEHMTSLQESASAI